MPLGCHSSQADPRHLVGKLSGWLVLCTALYIPWHAGGNAPLATAVSAALMFSAGLLWVGECVAARTFPQIPVPCALFIILLLLQGLGMTLNAHHRFESAGQKFRPIDAPWSKAPGTMDAAASQTALLNTASMLLALCIACDLGHRRIWRQRFCFGMALSGSLIALFGLAQKFGVANDRRAFGGLQEGTPFATFSYHANAGAFLNLCLPAAFVVMLVECRGAWSLPRKTLACMPFVFILAGCVVNVSRAAQVITILIAFGLILWAVRPVRTISSAHAPSRFGRTRRTALPILVLLLVSGTAVVTTWSRWSQMPRVINSKNPRLLLWRICLHFVPEAGRLGFGPGTYKLIYPTAPSELLRDLYPRHIVKPHVPGQPVSMWNQAHQDYLQLTIEWGWIGAILWVAILFGGLARVVFMPRKALLGNFDSALAVALAFAITGVLMHALVDFPLQILSIQMCAGICLGLAWSSRRWIA